MNIIVIDNYDSFTYNLVQCLQEVLGTEGRISVYRNDQLELAMIERFDAIVISPGPGIPEEAGLTKSIIETYSGQIPILGVCLGLQSIVEVFGGSLINLDKVYHGVHSLLSHIDEEETLFEGIALPMQVGRYHSWVANSETMPATLRVTSTDESGQVMSVRHREHCTIGVQFHPESILTPEGKKIVSNFVREVGEKKALANEKMKLSV